MRKHLKGRGMCLALGLEVSLHHHVEDMGSKDSLHQCGGSWAQRLHSITPRDHAEVSVTMGEGHRFRIPLMGDLSWVQRLHSVTMGGHAKHSSSYHGDQDRERESGVPSLSLIQLYSPHHPSQWSSTTHI